MDELLDVLFFAFAFFIVFILAVGLSGGFDPTAYCADGQAAIKDDGDVVSCVILPPAVPQGYVLPPGVPSPAPVIVAPLYK